MAVVVVLTHRVRGLDTAPARTLPRPLIEAECFCGWRMSGLKAQAFSDAGHLHYAMEGHTRVVYRLPAEGEPFPEGWAVGNLARIVYDGMPNDREFVLVPAF